MINGFVEAIRPFQVRGWASDDEAPGLRLGVQVRIEGRLVGSAAADLLRLDLIEAEVGDGRHGFVVNVTETLPLAHPSSIIVETTGFNGVAKRLPAFTGLTIDPVDIALAEPEPPTSITGYFAVASFEVSGWAYDTEKPHEHLDVAVEVDGETIGRIRANLFRRHLVLAGIGLGDHGFNLTLPSRERNLHAGKTRVFALSASGSRIPLGIAVVASKPEPMLNSLAFPGLFVDPGQHPIVILGAARSGTSAIAQALIACGRYEGFEEGHFLDLLTPLMNVTSQFYQSRTEEWTAGRSTQLASIPQSFVEQGLKSIIVAAAKLTFPSGKWVDKTPRAGMIALAPVLKSVWPNARFIYMRRRALENLDSRLRKFPKLDFAAHCHEWALSIHNWYAVTSTLGESAMEIDQVYMARHPAETAATIGEFLRLPGSAIDGLSQALSFDQPERTAAQFGAVADIESVGWSREQIESFRTICEPAMQKAGYGNGADYFYENDMSRGLAIGS